MSPTRNVVAAMSSATVFERAATATHHGPPTAFTHRGDAGVEGDGPFVTIWLDIRSGVVDGAWFNTFGCPSAIASADLVAEVCVGRSTGQLAALDAEDVMRILGGLPAGKRECAELAIRALHGALREATHFTESEG